MGSFLVILSGLGFSTVGIFGKLAFLQGFTRNQMLFYRFLFALPFLALVLLFSKAWPKDLKAYSRAVLVGAIGIGIEATVYFISLERMGAALTAVFLYLYPAFVALISHFFLKQKLTGFKWGCVALSLVGCVLTVGPVSHEIDATGIVFGLLTGFAYSVYLLFGAKLTQDQNPLTVSSGVVLGAAITFGLMLAIDTVTGAALQAQAPDAALSAVAQAIGSRVAPPSWLPIFGLALFASVLPFTTLYAGMKRVGATQASVLSTLELVFTIVFAALFLGETLTLLQILGAGLVLTSVFALLMERDH